MAVSNFVELFICMRHCVAISFSTNCKGWKEPLQQGFLHCRRLPAGSTVRMFGKLFILLAWCCRGQSANAAAWLGGLLDVHCHHLKMYCLWCFDFDTQLVSWHVEIIFQQSWDDYLWPHYHLKTTVPFRLATAVGQQDRPSLLLYKFGVDTWNDNVSPKLPSENADSAYTLVIMLAFAVSLECIVRIIPMG